MSRPLQLVPASPRRDGVYIRVSAVMGRADERFLSPEIQRDSIDRARARGPESTVVAEWRDIDVSTARVAAKDRPGLQAALAAARAGEIDRLWFLTLDRFDRDTAALRTFDEVAASGVELWTEVGRVDVETPEGYLSTTMQLAIARYQRDRIGKAWRQTHQHRVERGLTHSGKDRWGYLYDRERRIHVPDPVNGPVVAEVYRRYVAGETVHGLVRWLNGAGHFTMLGNPWSDRVLRRALDSGFAAGILVFRGEVFPGVHEPLIDPVLWDQYQAARDLRRGSSNVERSQYLLSGLVRCACGSPMVAGQYGQRREPKYRCKAAKESGRHQGGYVMARFVEAEVLRWLRDLAQDTDDAIDLTVRVSRARDRRADEAGAAARQLEDIRRRLTNLTLQLAAGTIREQAYKAATEVLYAQQDSLVARIADLDRARRAAAVARPREAAAALLADWDHLGVPQRREALRRLVDRVVVKPGRPRGMIVVHGMWDPEG